MNRKITLLVAILALLAPALHKITPVFHHCAAVCAPIHRIG